MQPFTKLLTSILGRIQKLILENPKLFPVNERHPEFWGLEYLQETIEKILDPYTQTEWFAARYRRSRERVTLGWWYSAMGNACEAMTYYRDYCLDDLSDVRLGARDAALDCIGSLMYNYLGMYTQIYCERHKLPAPGRGPTIWERDDLYTLKQKGQDRVRALIEKHLLRT